MGRQPVARTVGYGCPHCWENVPENMVCPNCPNEFSRHWNYIKNAAMVFAAGDGPEHSHKAEMRARIDYLESELRKRGVTQIK